MAHNQLTREGLERAKARGVLLGSARPGHWDGREHLRGWKKGVENSIKARHGRVLATYAAIIPPIVQMRADECSFDKIACWLNANGHTTSKGNKFTPAGVWRIMGKVEAKDAAIEAAAEAGPEMVTRGLARPRHWDTQEHIQNLSLGVARSVSIRKDDAMTRAMLLAPLVLEIRSMYSLADVADILNGMGIPTSRGKLWTAAGVSRLIAHIEDAQAADNPTGEVATRLNLERRRLAAQ